MKKILILFTLLANSLFFYNANGQSTATLIDDKATKKTRALYSNLKKLSEKGFMFGHEGDAAYGVSWKAVDGRSDVKEVLTVIIGIVLKKQASRNIKSYFLGGNSLPWYMQSGFKPVLVQAGEQVCRMTKRIHLFRLFVALLP